MSASTCRGCGASIVWVRSLTSAKGIPCDPPVLLEYVIPLDQAGARAETEARVSLVTATGAVVTGIIGSVLDGRAVPHRGRLAHFATCPHAARFRGMPRHA